MTSVSNHLAQPTESDNIDCHLQQVGMGTLICRAARRTGDNTTNEVERDICLECDAGRIFREVGCDGVSPKIHIYPYMGGKHFSIETLFCRVRKTETTLDYCRTCGLAAAETTRQVVSTARGLFQAQGFYSAYKDLEKSRTAIRDGDFPDSVTASIACLESVMRVCHEQLGQPLPGKKQLTDLWKSTREILCFEDLDPSGTTLRLTNSLAGVVHQLATLRNALADAHGKGTFPPDVSETIAELALNVSATLSTLVIRRFNQIRERQG